jgi:hypothetical protein
MKTEYGVKAIALARYFAMTPFASLLVSLLKSIVLFVKEIAKMPSVRVFFPLMKSLSYALLLAIQRPIHRNFGFYNALSMAFDAVLATGMTKSMQILRSIGPTPSLEDPCLYSGFVHDPSAPSGPKLTSILTPGLYVDNFVYFSEDPAVESLFCHLLTKRCKVDFMGIVEWFLGICFSWHLTSSLVAVHLNQLG